MRSTDKNYLPKLASVAELICDDKISVNKVKDLCSDDQIGAETRTIEIKGVKALTVRRDSNGTPTMSFRKEMLERYSMEDIIKIVVDGAKDGF